MKAGGDNESRITIHDSRSLLLAYQRNDAFLSGGNSSKERADIMKNLYASAVAIGLGILGVAVTRALLPTAPVAPASAAIPTTIFSDVTQHHNHASRDGLYLDPLFTQTAAAN